MRMLWRPLEDDGLSIVCVDSIMCQLSVIVLQPSWTPWLQFNMWCFTHNHSRRTLGKDQNGFLKSFWIWSMTCVVPLDKAEVSVCESWCIKSNARVAVILPDWHNYGWDLWRYTVGVSSDHLRSSEGCSLVRAGKAFIQGEVSLDQPEGLLQKSYTSQVWYAWALLLKRWQKCPGWMIYHVSSFEKPRQSQANSDYLL